MGQERAITRERALEIVGLGEAGCEEADYQHFALFLLQILLLPLPKWSKYTGTGAERMYMESIGDSGLGGSGS